MQGWVLYIIDEWRNIMKRFCINRILQSLIALILVSIFSFAIIRLAPGDVSSMYLRPDMSEEEKQATIIKLGLDKSPMEQFVSWAKLALKGNMGISLANKHPVMPQLVEKIPATVLLMGTSLILSLLIAIPLGMIAGLKKDSLLDNIIGAFTYIGISIPQFWLGMVLIVVFALKLHLLPTSGMRTVGIDNTVDKIKHLILPCLTVSFPNIATFTRYIRSNTISELEEEYILTAKSKGSGSMKILFKHVLKNSLLPIISLVGMNLASLVVGSFIVESVFGWPGLGTLGMSAASSRDYPMIMAFTMLSATILILGNFIADILYAFADPRIKQGMEMDYGK